VAVAAFHTTKGTLLYCELLSVLVAMLNMAVPVADGGNGWTKEIPVKVLVNPPEVATTGGK
jgi:hypothetical protein